MISLSTSSSALPLAYEPQAWCEDDEESVLLPPGPTARVVSNLRLVTDPIEALREWQATYGDTFTVDRMGVPTVMTADRQLIARLHGSGDPDLFAAAVPEPTDVLLGSRSLLLLSGKQHLRERKLMMPPFHGERMRGWAVAMAEAGQRAFTDLGEGDEFRALDLTQRVTLEVIIRVIFGVDEARVQEFTDAVLDWTDALRSGFLFLRALQRDFLGLSPYARYRRARDRVDALLLDQIARSRAGGGGGTDVLTGLVEARYDDGSAMDDETIRDHLRTLLFAGHDTTAITLAWAMYFVHRNPAVAERLRGELAGVDIERSPELLARLPYLGAVIDETLRMRPISVDNQRTLRKPFQLGPWSLPAGAAVCPAVTLLHFHPDYWAEPERFAPERFLGGKPAANTFMPFGGGVHRCLGAVFARFEACVVLGTVLRAREFEALDDPRWVRCRGTLGPDSGVRMGVRASL
ncbi:MAG: cytochrome P450 [Myxococcales bacterium]|nr:cytochrome P450 [Myxococcales bacterium]